ncbi:MAG TPA: FAD-dependent oxidoreductase [Acidobacteriota bacterium]|nr:FAD-dependent oxidoreductase [Acidobacteriota bacterium]
MRISRRTGDFSGWMEKVIAGTASANISAMREKIVVIGGNAAGMTAASRAKRLEPDLSLLILEAGRYISYSICGVPRYVTGGLGQASELTAFNPQSLKQERGIEARTRVRVEEIWPGRRMLSARDLDSGEAFRESYDRLVLAAGYVPRRPDVEGCQLDNVFTVSRLEHGEHIRRAVQTGRTRRAAVIGGGYIGLMMAEALRQSGLQVVLLEREAHIQPNLDDDLCQVLEEELSRQGVELRLRTPVRRLCGEGRVEAVEASGERLPVDLALIDVGVAPNIELASRAGITLGVSGAIQVDPRGCTDVHGIYAAGNCAETRHLVSRRPLFSTLGTTAAKQGRVVGENLAGLRSTFRGTLETSVERIFNLAAARTGLTLRQALQCGFEGEALTVKARDRAAYMPESKTLRVRLVWEKRSGRLLGGQMVGPHASAKRIDTLVAALSAEMKIDDLAQLDLAYAPPFGTLWDPIQIAANQALKRLRL